MWYPWRVPGDDSGGASEGNRAIGRWQCPRVSV